MCELNAIHRAAIVLICADDCYISKDEDRNAEHSLFSLSEVSNFCSSIQVEPSKRNTWSVPETEPILISNPDSPVLGL